MEDAESIIRQGIERWNAHDRDGFLALYDEEISFVGVGAHELHGREEFGAGFFDLWTEAYPDNELKDPFVFTDGEWVCFQGRFTGTHTGVFHGPEMDMPPTGKRVDGPFVFIAQVQDGKVKSSRIYYDRLTTLEQEGVIDLEQFAAQLAHT